MWEDRGLRVGVVAATEPAHASAQVARSCIKLGIVDIRPLPVTLPLKHIVAGPTPPTPRCSPTSSD
jgi:hypothetical protein